MDHYVVDQDITHAHTLPGSFYADQHAFEHMRNHLFPQSWQAIDLDPSFVEYNTYPFTLLDEFLQEPLLLTRHRKKELCLSNVCTHRGNLLLTQPGHHQNLRCRYHGKCFDMDGTYKSMPGFESAQDFPTKDDHLPNLVMHKLGPFRFTSIHPAIEFSRIIDPLRERMSWFDFDALIYHPELSRTYHLDAHWALYCENYLEGFHIPFVHEKLNKRLNFSEYHTEIFEYSNLQTGIAKEDEPHFNLPASSPDFGKKILAYYWWLYPNTMFNIYTWGISFNIIMPITTTKTQIRFKTYLLPGVEPTDLIAETLDHTEMEDESIVLDVQSGVTSRLYQRGRFSPTMEKGVHHFQSLVASDLQRGA